MNVLVAGGSGYIGSHTVVELIEQKYNVIIVDNLSNSKVEVLNRIKRITGVMPTFYKVDLRNKDELRNIFKSNKIDCVINFAGLKAVGESVNHPLDYYDNNISSAVSLLEVMQEFNCFNLIFSSSATVYGNPEKIPVNENTPVGKPTNPYGKTKLMIENILEDLYASDNRFNIAILRYFNPIGAHPSGLIGEDPNGIPNNLAPYITQVLVGKRECLNVYGNDYNTPDGTCLRDYIHVCDLAIGHILAIKKLMENPGLIVYNLGTGIPSSVLDIIYAFEKAAQKVVPYKIADRRQGDIRANYTQVTKAYKELGFACRYGINDMAKHQWNWQKNNPNGYDD